MLNSHSQIAIPPESHFLSELIYDYPADRELTQPEIDQITNQVANHTRFEHWQSSSAQLRKRVAQSGNRTLAGLIDLVYRLETGAGKRRWGDKTPGYERHFDRLAEIFPAAHFIHIHRDGRDVSNSMRQRKWHGITEFQRANHWCRSIESAFESSRRLGPSRCMNVPYEQLVRSPQQTLMHICEFLGEPFELQMLKFNQGASDHLVDPSIHSKLVRLPDPVRDLQRWKRESSKTRILLFEALADQNLTAAGYDLSFSTAARTWAKLAYWLPGSTISKMHEVYLSAPKPWRRGLRNTRWISKIRNLMYQGQSQAAEAKSG